MICICCTGLYTLFTRILCASVSFLFDTFAYPLLYILPAYIANGAPVIFGGGAPLDMHRKIGKKRIFGNNKTFRGTAFMMLGAIVIGLAEYPFFKYMLAIAVLLGIGTILGDLIGSFIKRRIELKPGRPFPIMDQYGFFIFALILAYPLGHLPDTYGLIFIIILTGVMHLLTNIGAHLLKLKDVPW